MEKINVNVENGVHTLEIREGKALELKQPVKVEIKGTIHAPLEWLKQRKDSIVAMKSHIIVDYDKRSIMLVDNEKSALSTVISGQLELSPDFIKFGINAGKYRTPLEMGEFIKMNRAFFENRQQAMELVTQLRKFKAKIDKQVEVEANLNKGDRRILVAQVVDSNVPEKFNIVIPIFKGSPRQIIEVETYFNPDDLTCTLVSPMANESIEDVKREIIESVIVEIVDICPDIVIIEQ